MFFLILLGLVTLAGIIYLAISPKSTFQVRITALAALALMVITVVICVVLFFKGAAEPKVFILPDVDISELPPPEKRNVITPVMFIIFLIALFATVLLLSLKEQGKGKNKKVNDTGNNWDL